MPRKSPIERFNEKYRVDPDTGCWMWIACKNSDGYGQLKIERKTIGAHRFSYEYFIGDISEELEIDHLCKARDCVNPYHLETVKHSTNVARGDLALSNRNRVSRTHCNHGHSKNKYGGVNKAGHIFCSECQRIKHRRLRLTKKLKNNQAEVRT